MPWFRVGHLDPQSRVRRNHEITSKTSITSTNGVTLISLIGSDRGARSGECRFGLTAILGVLIHLVRIAAIHRKTLGVTSVAIKITVQLVIGNHRGIAAKGERSSEQSLGNARRYHCQARVFRNGDLLEAVRDSPDGSKQTNKRAVEPFVAKNVM